MESINCVNLDQLIETIKLNKESLSMAEWFSNKKGYIPYLKRAKATDIFHRCDTVACVAGFAGVINKEQAIDVGAGSLKRLINCCQLDASHICLGRKTYEVQVLEQVEAGSVIAVLEEMLKRALKAQRIQLV